MKCWTEKKRLMGSINMYGHTHMWLQLCPSRPMALSILYKAIIVITPTIFFQNISQQTPHILPTQGVIWEYSWLGVFCPLWVKKGCISTFAISMLQAKIMLVMADVILNDQLTHLPLDKMATIFGDNIFKSIFFYDECSSLMHICSTWRGWVKETCWSIRV